MPFNGRPVDDAGRVIGVIISFVVRGQINGHISSLMALPYNPLSNVRFVVSTPMLRSDADGWNECELVRSRILLELSNRDFPSPAAFGYWRLKGDSALLHATVSASTGTWDYISVIRLINGKLETRELLTGQFFGDNYNLRIDEHSTGFPLDEQAIPLIWGKELFMRYRVAPVPANQLTRSCQEIVSRLTPLMRN
jgi:hypothetical protein